MNRFILFFVTIALLLGARAYGQQKVEAPQFVDGDFCQYQVVEQGEYMKTERELNGIYEIAYSNGAFKVFKVETDRKDETRSGVGVLIGLFN